MIDLKSDYHIHASYNDHSEKDLTVPNIIKTAESKSLENIAITEHVRKTSNWIDKYIDEILTYSKKTKIKTTIGFEAKILSNGDIDCPDIIKKYFIIASFHTKYNNKKTWLDSLKSVICNSKVDVIGHLYPEQSFKIEDREIKKLGKLIADNNKIVEINAKYHAPPIKWLQIFKNENVNFHLASDAHRLKDIGDFNNILDLIKIVE